MVTGTLVTLVVLLSVVLDGVLVVLGGVVVVLGLVVDLGGFAVVAVVVLVRQLQALEMR